MITNIDQAVKERSETYEAMGRLEQQDPSLLFAKPDAELARKNLSYFQSRARLDAIDWRQNEAFTGLYQWNAVWAVPAGGLYGLFSGKGAVDRWGADRLPSDSRGVGRIHHGSETMARTLLDVLQGLVLPTLYAALGAWVRLIRDQRRHAAGPHEAPIDAREPLMLGAIVGSVLGFFYSSNILGAQLTALPLMGLSFFAGYSIDWLFQNLDRLASPRQAANSSPATDAPPVVHPAATEKPAPPR